MLEPCCDRSAPEGPSDVQSLLNGLANFDRYTARRSWRLPLEFGHLVIGSVPSLTLGAGTAVKPRASARGFVEQAFRLCRADALGVCRPTPLGPASCCRRWQGESFGDEEIDDKRLLCRFLWSREKSGSPRWEQAFSADGDNTWETNWIMTFTRRERNTDESD